MLKVPLPTNMLLLGLRIPFDVYLKDGRNFIHLFTKWTLFDQRTKETLDIKGINTVYIEGTPSNIKEYLDNSSGPQYEAVDTEKFYVYSRNKEMYHNIDKTLLIDKSSFIRNTKINFNIYLINNMLIELLAEAAVEEPIEIPDRVFKARGDLAIRTSDINLYKEYLNNLLSSPDIPEEMRQKCKAISLKENSKILVRDVLSSPHVIDKMDEVGTAVAEITDSILKKQVSVYDMMSLKTYDLYTYTHSVNVAVLCIAIGSALGFERRKIEKLGVGALMHDIGKSILPKDLINKQGRLTKEEFSLLKTHVIEGFRILEAAKEMEKESLVVVLQHHERLSGKGYPFGLNGEKVKVFGRIAAMVDCYDCLITPRPFRYAYTPYMALTLLTRETKETGDFDPDYLTTFITLLSELS
ncbi:MAG: HD-GYP domain-containing protein [Dissulfurispiraceae bacterium]